MHVNDSSAQEQSSEAAVARVTEHINSIHDFGDQEAILLVVRDLLEELKNGGEVTNDMIVEICTKHKLDGPIADQAMRLFAMIASLKNAVVALSDFVNEHLQATRRELLS